jgi:ADP-heptose:LPS heptosyltransferase
MRNILVLRGGALGDFIVTLPALAGVRARWPEARIELVGNATAAQLARRRGLIDAVHSQQEARWGALYGTGNLPPEFAGWLAAFDLIVNFWPDPEGDLRRRFPLRPEHTYRSTAALPERAPAAAHYCQPLAEWGIVPRDFCFQIEARRPTPLIAIHPGSGSRGKNWPAENWRALIATLPTPLCVILGEAELEAWSEVPFPSGVATIVRQPLEAVVTRLSACRLFLGHDSGIAHLAAACGVPSLLLFGPTDPAMWAPPTPRTRVLRRGPNLAAISVAEVRAAAATLLAE